MSYSAVNRANRWRARQREYLQDRRTALRELQSNELAHDIATLRRPWMPAADVNPNTHPNPFVNQPWFHSRTMDGSTGHPLEFLSTYAKEFLTESELIEIEILATNFAWRKEKALPSYGKVDSPEVALTWC